MAILPRPGIRAGFAKVFGDLWQFKRCASSHVRESSPAMDLRHMSKAYLQRDSDEAHAYSNHIKMAKRRRNASRSDPIGMEIGKST